LKRSYALWSRICRHGAGVLALPLLLQACAVSHISNPFRSRSEDQAATAVTPDRLLETAKADNGSSDIDPASGTHCPQVVAWPTDRFLTAYQPGHTGDSLSIIHRGEITKLARECQLYPDRVVVRYGFAGRVLLGPKGMAGTVTLPVSIHVADVEHKTLAKDAVKVTTTIAQDNPVGYFSMVKEISFPIVQGTRPEDYKIFVAFDRSGPGMG
jgi:hypothetical protein